MNRSTRFFLAALLGTAALLAGCASQPPAPLLKAEPKLVNRGTDGNLADGVRAVLKLSVQRGISDLARPNGFQRFDATRLPMPAVVEPTARFLRAWGRSRLVEPLMMDINRGMEIAAGRFLPLLEQRVDDLLIPDVRGLMVSGDTAISDLLCAPDETRRSELREAYAPVLKQALVDAGYPVSRGHLVNEYNSIPMLEDIEPFDVEPELLERGINAICLRIAHQETRIRRFEAERPVDTPDAEAIRHLFAYPF
ncbi:MAG: DUF4197 family protein [Gammaproteobacteria bacterium]